MYLVCGEALYDVFLDAEDASGDLRLEARPGGSPFNVAIGIARLGGRSALLTGMSRDMLGERLERTLKRESVSTDYLIRSGRRTTLSLVGFDQAGQPAERSGPSAPRRGTRVRRLTFPWPGRVGRSLCEKGSRPTTVEP